MSSDYQLIKKVNLTIVNQDWDRVRARYLGLKEKISSNELQSDYILSDNDPTGIIYGQTFYYFKHLGSIDSTDERISNNWDSWRGQLFYSLCPWYKQAVKLFAPLDLAGIAWSVNYEDIKLHIDQKPSDKEAYDQCKINYIVDSQDIKAKTIVYDLADSNRYFAYESIPNTAWLLDTNHPHEVNSTGKREIVQFKFWNSFDQVAKFLDQTGPIIFDAKK
jgi:hypothetical protein